MQTNGELRQSSLQFTKGKKKSPINRRVRFLTADFDVISEKLKDSFKYKVDRTQRVIDRIEFRFSYHAIFIEKGWGRNNHKNRVAKPFFTPILTKRVSQLADNTNKIFADKTVKNVLYEP